MAVNILTPELEREAMWSAHGLTRRAHLWVVPEEGVFYGWECVCGALPNQGTLTLESGTGRCRHCEKVWEAYQKTRGVSVTSSEEPPVNRLGLLLGESPAVPGVSLPTGRTKKRST